MMGLIDTLWHGEALDMLREIADDSLDACVTDPPAGIEFMAQEWDSFSRAEANPSGPQTETWHDNGGTNPYARQPTPRYTGKQGMRDLEARAAFVAFLTGIFNEVYRVLKPGGHALVWSLPRTSHWTAWALEDAGFEIRDRIAHIFGSGFPKSLDISKAIDKKMGAQREVIGTKKLNARDKRTYVPSDGGGYNGIHSDPAAGMVITAPATDAAREWEGWGTALKPSVEDWWLIRKPIVEANVASNVLRFGTGALNIDGTRVETTDSLNGGGYSGGVSESMFGDGIGGRFRRMQPDQFEQPAGRWPPHLVLSHSIWCDESQGPLGCDDLCPVLLLDKQSGTSRSSGGNIYKKGHGTVYGGGWNPNKATKGDPGYGDTGGASRFYPTFYPGADPLDDLPASFLYRAKPSRSERDTGLEALPVKGGGEATGGRTEGSAGLESPRSGAGRLGGVRNFHPTVKSVGLMRWLCRLITPPGGTLLDCFAGSCTTGVAAIAEGFHFILIERTPAYWPIGEARLAHARFSYGPKANDATEVIA